MRSDRAFAYSGALLGLIASLGANVLHVLKLPDPDVWAVVGAGFWPFALLVSSEVLARKRWASKGARIAGVIGVLVVALVAAWISYGHVHGLLVSWGEPPIAAALGPLAIDGLMVVSSLALVAQDAPAITLPASIVDSTAAPVPPAAAAPVPDPVPVVPGGVSTRPVAVASPRPRRHRGAGQTGTSDEEHAQRLIDDELVGASQRAVAAHLRVSQARAGRILAIANRWAAEQTGPRPIDRSAS